MLSARTEKNVKRWAEQKWILDSIIQSVGVEWDQPRLIYTLLPCGPDALGEIKGIGARVRKFSDMHREFAASARRREARAQGLETQGRFVSARDEFFLASLLYGAARWPVFETNDISLSYNAKMISCYERYMAHAPRPTRRVEIPFGDHVLPGILHLPRQPAPGEKLPCVIAVDGMDASKEIMVSIYGDKLLERGIAVFAYDGPGQGECPLNGLFVTPTNHMDAALAVHDWLSKQPEIDPDRLAANGVSFGSFFGLQIAAALGNKILGTAVAMVCHQPGMDMLMNSAAPSYKMRFMYMSGYDDEAAFDEFIKTFDLAAALPRIGAPVLIIAGADDELSPIEFTEKLASAIEPACQLAVYEGERHALNFNNLSTILGEHWPVMQADWLAARFEGKPAPSGRLYIDSFGRTRELPYGQA